MLSCARKRLQALGADQQRVVRALMHVSLFVLVGRMAGAAREVAIAARYGAGAEVDAYVLVSGLVGWPVSVWTSVLSTVLLPLLVREAQAAGMARFRDELLGASLLLGLMVGLACAGALHFAIAGGHLALAPQIAAVALAIIPALALTAAIGVVLGFYSMLLMAGGSHLNTLLEGAAPLTALAAVLLIPGGGIVSLVGGTLAGLVLQLALSAVLQPARPPPWPRLSFQARVWTPFTRGVAIVVAGQVVISATGAADQLMVAGLGVSANATLDYANRLIALAMSVGAVVVARSMLPVFAGIGDRSRTLRLAGGWSAALFTAGAAGVIVAWPLAPWAVQLLFERGAFTAADTAAVAGALRTGLLQVPPFLAGMVMVQLLASRSAYTAFLLLGLLGFVVKVGLNLVLIPRLGVAGAMAASAGMYLVNVVVLHVIAYSPDRTRAA